MMRNAPASDKETIVETSLDEARLSAY